MSLDGRGRGAGSGASEPWTSRSMLASSARWCFVEVIEFLRVMTTGIAHRTEVVAVEDPFLAWWLGPPESLGSPAMFARDSPDS